MKKYILTRLALFPLTILSILLVNFVILNLAPGDPTEMMEGAQGEAGRLESLKKQSLDDPYFQFREHFGLTLPILFNNWPFLTREAIEKAIEKLQAATLASEKHRLLLKWSDRAPFILHHLLAIASDTEIPFENRRLALNFFVRGGFRLGHVGSLSSEKKEENKKIEKDNRLLLALYLPADASKLILENNLLAARIWFAENKARFAQNSHFWEKASLFFGKTRFCRYFWRLLHLDFGTLRSDMNKKVIDEVAARLKYSLTLSLIPMIASFGLAQIFGMVMALWQNRWVDFSLNTLFLILYAIPLFVFAPFVIEKIALGHTLPFTHIAIPISGFQSDMAEYSRLTSLERLGDIALHLALPLLCLLYWMVAAQAKLARTTFLEILNQDYIKMARAKGLPTKNILFKHVGRNASITMVTALASSIGVVLSGSLIVETLFNIHGFGRFFYEAILSRDYHVILFSAIAGSILSCMGYLVADIAYMLLDPRIRMSARGTL